MKGTIATVELFAARSGERPRRLTLVIGAPEREGGTAAGIGAGAAGGAWRCRVALADLHPPRAERGRDSVEALARALARGRNWLKQLEDDGFALFRDRTEETRFELDAVLGEPLDPG